MCGNVRLMDRDRELAILRDYESVLADAEREIADLRTVINVVRARLKVTSGRLSEPAANDGASRTTYRGRPNIPSVLKEILADGKTRSTEDIYRLVREHPAFRDRPPSRGSVQNRLGDLAYANELERPETGHYRLPTRNGNDTRGNSPRRAEGAETFEFAPQNGGD